MHALLLAASLAAAAPPALALHDDPRITLFALTRALAVGPPEPAAPHERALFDALVPASACREHAAVKRAAALGPGRRRQEALSRLFDHGPPPRLEALRPSPTTGGWSEQEWAGFIADLRDFAARCRFGERFAAAAAARERWLKRARREAAAGIAPETVFAYAGVAGMRLRLVPAPFLRSPTPQAAGRRRQRAGVIEQVRMYDAEAGWRLARFGQSAAHEAAHLAVGALPARLWLDLQGYMMPLGCLGGLRDWGECFEEHVVYALELRLEALRGRPEAAAAALERTRERGFIGVARMALFLKSAEEDGRQKYGLGPLLGGLMGAAARDWEREEGAAEAGYWLDEAERQAAAQRRGRVHALLERARGLKPDAAAARRIAALEKELETMPEAPAD